MLARLTPSTALAILTYVVSSPDCNFLGIAVERDVPR
jgi:hypothetical protein